MIREQNLVTRVMFYILLVMIGFLAALIALNLRQPRVGLMLLSEEEGGVRTYGHIDSYGLTEVVQDKNDDGIYEHHSYRIAPTVESDLILSILNESGFLNYPDGYVLQFVDRRLTQRSAALSVTERDDAGAYRVCNISFSHDGSKPDISYSDWNFDGRIDVEMLENGKLMNARMGDNWLPIMLDKPRQMGEFVTVSLNGTETRLNFVDGEFVAATP